MLAYDIREDPAAVALGVEYVPKERVLQEADILSLHCPLLPSTYHIIDADRCSARSTRQKVHVRHSSLLDALEQFTCNCLRSCSATLLTATWRQCTIHGMATCGH